MVIRQRIYIGLLLSVFVFFGCGIFNPDNKNASFPTEAGVYIVPQAGNGINLANPSITDAPSRTPTTPLYLNVPDSYVISLIVNRNLDQDIEIEQIALYRDTSDSDYIQILIIDYDRQRESYIFAWEEQSAAQNITGVNVEFLDLTGDEVNEILIYGRDEHGAFTLDVFEIQASSEEALVSLMNIGSFRSNSEIGIETGILPRIVIEQDEPATQNIDEDEPAVQNIEQDEPAVQDIEQNELVVQDIDQTINRFVLRAYQWSPNRNQFNSLTIPTAANLEINQQFFQKLINASASDLINLVAGSWITQTEAEGVFLIIDASAEIMHLQIDQRQVSFRWKGAFKTITDGFPTLHLTLLNEYIPSLVNQATITLLADDEIRLSIPNEPELSHGYRQITAEQTTSVAPRFINSNINLNGWYEGVWGDEQVAIYFYENNYLIEYLNSQLDLQQKGVFSIYELDVPILELVELDKNRVIGGHQQYMITYQQRHEGRQLVRALELRPIIVRYHGHNALEGPSLQLVQVINIHR